MMKFIFSLFFLFQAAWVLGQSPAYTVKADKDQILLGAPFQLVFETTITPGNKPAWVIPDSIPRFEILQVSAIDSQMEGGDLRLRQTVTITSWDSGRIQLPAFKGAGKKPLAITVSYTPMDPKQDYNDIKEIIEVRPPSRQVWYWYLLLGALLLGFILLLFPYNRKKRPAPAMPSDPGIYKRSMEQLGKLEKNISRMEPKEFYTELVSVFRVYLQRRKGILSAQQTTSELAKIMEEKRLPVSSELVLVLQDSDGVKFARYPASDAEKEQALQVIKSSLATIEKVS